MGPNRKLQGGFLMKKHSVRSPTEKTVISESTKTNLQEEINYGIKTCYPKHGKNIRKVRIRW